MIIEKERFEFVTNKTNRIDQVLEVIYIEPNYNYEKIFLINFLVVSIESIKLLRS